ncbi:MAG: thiamine pyrophosphate-dependent enzyme, partial [Gammaproteobacteria bacterium]|nr:thiamine pyrophosphate-dependent enzyme [Gammaproteobacteria bacterium]
MGKGVVAEDHPLCLGTAALSDKDYLHCAVDRSDLIINVGHDVIEKPPFFMTDGGARVIHINYYDANVDEVYFPQHEVIGDIANALWQISESVKPQSHWDFDYFMRVKEFVDEKIAEKSDDDRFPVIPQRLVRDVRSIMGREDIIALDNGIYKVWFARNYRALAPNTILLDNALATMGAGLPSGMAAKMVFPDRKVLSICGDGGFMMNSQELETAVRMKLDIVVLILNDNSYGMIRWKQHGMGFPDYGLQYGNPDFVKYVESYGGTGHRIESTDQLATTLKNALESPGVHLVECPVDYSENSRVLTDELESREIIE